MNLQTSTKSYKNEKKKKKKNTTKISLFQAFREPARHLHLSAFVQHVGRHGIVLKHIRFVFPVLVSAPAAEEEE